MSFENLDKSNSSRQFKLQHELMFKCAKCNTIKLRIRSHRNKCNRWVFKDENGKIWDAGTCYICVKKENLLYRRKRGEMPRDLVTEKCNKKGRDSERTAERYFINLGYSVKINDVLGPDLTIEKDGIIKTVEVKSVIKSIKNHTYFVMPVYKTRKNDDFICYVYLDTCHVFSMNEHLSKCNKDGTRFITHLFRTKMDQRKQRILSRKSATLGIRRMKRKWQAYTVVNKRQISLGVYENIDDAKNAYNIKMIELYGDYAVLNDI